MNWQAIDLVLDRLTPFEFWMLLVLIGCLAFVLLGVVEYVAFWVIASLRQRAIRREMQDALRESRLRERHLASIVSLTDRRFR